MILWHPEHGFTDGDPQVLGPLGWEDGMVAHARIQAAKKAAMVAAPEVEALSSPSATPSTDGAAFKRKPGRPKKQ